MPAPRVRSRRGTTGGTQWTAAFSFAQRLAGGAEVGDRVLEDPLRLVWPEFACSAEGHASGLHHRHEKSAAHGCRGRRQLPGPLVERVRLSEVELRGTIAGQLEGVPRLLLELIKPLVGAKGTGEVERLAVVVRELFGDVGHSRPSGLLDP